ncbi:BspA family leucine-rich repeat surface protein [Enterococcus faecium]|nr:BspA family leucine-rich repeat surface protein [Enterococcus faecium]
MNSRKYKYIILSSAILGSLGFASLTTYSDTVDSNQQQVTNKSELNTQSSVENTIQKISNPLNIQNNSTILPEEKPFDNKSNLIKSSPINNRSIPIGVTVESLGQEVIGEWLVNKYRYLTNGGTIQQTYYELVQYKGNSQYIEIPTMLERILDNVLIDTSNLDKIIPNYKDVKRISFSRNPYAYTIPAKVVNGKIQIVDKISFANWSNLESFNGLNLDTSHIKDMSYLFSECTKLREVSFEGWDTRNVRNMEQMFFDCRSIETLDIQNFYTPNLSNANYMFAGCGASIIRMDNFNMNSVYSNYGMFENTPSGKELLITTRDSKLLSFNYPNRIPFKTPKLIGNGGTFQNKSTEINYFEKCAVLPEKINIDEFNKFKEANIPTNLGFGSQFLGWKTSGLSNSNPKSVIDLLGSSYTAQWGNPNWEFEEDDSRILLTKYKGISSEVIVPTNHNGKKIVLKDISTSIIPTTVTKFSAEKGTGYKLTIQDTNLNNAFDGNINLNEVDFTNIDTSNITSMEVMFRNCANLKKVDFSNCNTTKVTSMGYMFQNCSNLSDVKFTNISTQSLNNTSYMFSGCINLKIIDLSSFNLNVGLNDSGMFTTDQKTELLVLTNDQKLQSIDYDKRFNRVPLKGPSFNAGGGNFGNNQKIKNYFEKCAYDPSIITMNKFNQFKSDLRPTRQEFATNFDSWIPQSQEPSNATSVLDLGNIVYKATWSDPNWDFTETDDKITLTKYKGQSTDINLVGELDGKNVELVDINTTVIPNKITKFLVKEKNNKKVSIKDTNLTRAFENNKNIVEVNLSGLEGTSIQSLDNMFNGCSNLIKVTLDGMNTQNVTNFKSMFYECQKLSEVNISQLNTQNVTDMSYLFYNCFKLSNINLSNWDTTKVTSMSRMFFNCPIESLDIRNFHTPVLKNTNRMFNGCSKLRIIRMDNFDMSKHTDSGAMFYRGGGTETLVVTNDLYLLNQHNFIGDNTHPFSKPVLNANGGKFVDQKGTKKYFERSAVTPEKLQLAQFEKFQSDNVPTKGDAVFRGWTESGTSKTDEGVLNLLDKTYTAIWKNTICNTSPDNKKIESIGSLGMVYLPQQFATNSTNLKDSGKQEILVNKSSSLNIGVRDITQSRDSWSMTGQLKWNSSSIPGAYIQLDANANSIKINQNDNVNPYDAGRDLVSANEEVMIGNAEQGHIKITSDSTNTVLKANPEKTKDAIYDYNLGEVSLVIPDAGVVQDGNYSANLEWNLSNAPQ